MRTLLTMAGLLVTLASAAITNLLPNPTFDGQPDAHGAPPGWDAFDHGTNHVKYLVVPGEHAAHMLRIENDGGENGLRLKPALPLLPDRTHLAGGWVQGVGQDARASLRFDYGTVARQWVASGLPLPRDYEPGWHEFRIAQASGHDKKADGSTHLALGLEAWGEGAAVFDGVWLTTVPTLPGFGANLLADGNFEEGIDTPRAADLYLPEEGKAKWDWADEAAHDGLRGVHLHEVTGEATVAVGRADRDRNFTYRLTGWARCRRGEATVRLIYVYNKEWSGWVESKPIPADGQWVQVSVDFDEGEQAPLCHSMMAGGFVKEGGDADFDSFDLREMPKPAK